MCDGVVALERIRVMGIHGGDIYRNQVDSDFSINVNPLGIPEKVVEALHQAVGLCGKYPDIKAEKLKRAVAGMLAVPEEYLLFGNGASELLMSVVRGIQAKKTVIPTPSFYGYEYAANAAGSKVVYYGLKQENNFNVTQDMIRVLTEDVNCLFLASPNNPTGVLLDRGIARAILQHCKDNGISVILDECFIEFCGDSLSMLSLAEEFENLIVIRAFTKIFSIPGVRIGYLICKDHVLRTKIASQLPEWNLSCFAQEAGCACTEQSQFLQKTVHYMEKERGFLEEGLRKKGFLVFPSKANFILIYSEKPLYERMLEKGILIRDCGNFRGLGKGFYRIAVKSRKENVKLLENL